MSSTIHHTNFVQVVHTLKPLLRSYQPLSVMPFDSLCDWLVWYWNRGTMTYVIEDEEPLGVCLIRLFRRLDQFEDHNVHEPTGAFCFIELAVARDGEIMGQMLESLISWWGPQQTMMWDRPGRTEQGTPRMFKWADFIKLARRLYSYGQLKNA